MPDLFDIIPDVATYSSVMPDLTSLMPEGYNTDRHTPKRLAAAQMICRNNWGASKPAFFIGGGGQCDVYGFFVAEGTIAAANMTRIGATLGTGVETKPVYSLEFDTPPRTEKICLRIPRASLSTRQKETLIREEAQWRGMMASVGIKDGVQLEIKHDLTSNNALGSPYIALQWAEGKPLKWNDSTPARQEDREKVIRQVVEMQMAMLPICHKGESATKYMEGLIIKQIARITEPSLNSDKRPVRQSIQKEVDQHIKAIMTLYAGSPYAMHQVQATLLKKHIIPELDNEPHVLVHGDLGEGNIIVDENHNITLIDLGYMHQEPLQLAAYFPRFLTHEPSSVASDCPIDRRMDAIGSVRGWGQIDSVQLAKDRKYYQDHVRAVAGQMQCLVKTFEEHQDLVRIQKLYSQVLERDDEVERFWWVQAMQRVDIWLQMERCEWEPRKGKKKDVDLGFAESSSKPLGATDI